MRFLHYGQWKGYVYWDDYTRLWRGRLIGIREVIRYQAEDEADIERVFREAVDALP